VKEGRDWGSVRGGEWSGVGERERRQRERERERERERQRESGWRGKKERMV
jgi:hypothetical protein